MLDFVFARKIVGIAVFSCVAVTAAQADHTPVEPFDLFRDPPQAHELPESERHRLDDPVPLPQKRSPVDIAKEEQEKQRIEEFKRERSEDFVRLPELSDDREERLNTLFDLLHEAQTDILAKRAETEIQKTWSQSGSETIDLLFKWAVEAMEKKDYAKALDFLDNIIVLEPDFAEAFNRRATVHFLTKEYARSIADVEKTLALEPRHFGALSGLGIMLRELGHDERALEAFKKAIGYNPTMKHLKKSIKDLEKKVLGRDA